jgi:hypothetical protein
LIEPDFLPVTIAEPPGVRAFWSDWLAWSRDRGIDYQIGRTLAPRVAALGIEKIGGTAETAIYNGTSLWADYWTETIRELRQDLTSSGKLNNALADTLLGYCADPAWWTQTIAFCSSRLRPWPLIDPPPAVSLAHMVRQTEMPPSGAVVICGETSNFRRCNEPGVLR